MLDLPAILKQAEAAIPSPWTLRREEPDVDVMSGETVIASMGDFYPEVEFVAAARTNVPLLVAALQEAQAEIKRLEALAACYPSWLPGESS